MHHLYRADTARRTVVVEDPEQAERERRVPVVRDQHLRAGRRRELRDRARQRDVAQRFRRIGAAVELRAVVERGQVEELELEAVEFAGQPAAGEVCHPARRSAPSPPPPAPDSAGCCSTSRCAGRMQVTA